MVGSGPNGLAAAIRLARAGLSVKVLEANHSPGGGVRTAELTLPGFLHDVCATSFPLGLASPFFRKLPLREHGLSWCHPPAPLAHPFDDGSAALLLPSLAETAARLGQDGPSWQSLFDRIVSNWDDLLDDILRPLQIPRHPHVTVPFGMQAVRSAAGVAQRFRDQSARALFSGCAAHGFLPLETRGTAAFGLVLAGSAHCGGWPFVAAGSGRLTDALIAVLEKLGGKIETGRTIRSLSEVPPAGATILDVTPRQLDLIAETRFPRRYTRRLQGWRYGPGVFKIDLALDGPIPWTNSDCATAGTVHLGGTMEEIAAAEMEVALDRHPARPFVLLTQPSLFDGARAPEGMHTAWAYCHVPHGSREDMGDRIVAQIERFAPGTVRRIVKRSTRGPVMLEAGNANLVGGDINGGRQDLWQTVARPFAGPNPYATPIEGLYLCSASTPPGGGVHGMCGYHAAGAALRDIFHLKD